jgi:type I restriction enzyme S subunit
MSKRFSLRKGWDRAKLGDLARNVKTIEHNPLEHGLERFVGLEHIDSESLRINRWGTIREGTSFQQRFEKGQILLGKRRAYLRKVAIADFDGLCSSDILVLESTGKMLIPELLPFVIQDERFFDFAVRTSSGSLSPRTKWRYLAEYQVPLPPTDEQRRIAMILQACEDCLVEYEALLHHAEITKKMLVNALLTVIGKMPNQWRVVKLQEVADVRYGLGQPPERDDDGIPMIRATNIKKGSIIETDLLRIKRSAIPKSRNPFLRKGDLIVVRSGAYTGDIGLITQEWEGGVAGYDLVVTPSEKVDSLFLASYLLSAKAQSYFSKLRSRSAQHHLNSQQVSETPIPLPPSSEQQQIACKLSIADAAITRTRDHIEMTKTMKMRLVRELLTKGVGT